MAIIVLTTFFVALLAILAWATLASGAAGTAAGPSADSRALKLTRSVSAPDRCPSARRGLRWYRGRYNEHRAKMGAGAPLQRGSRPPGACPRVRYLAKRWREKAYAARVTYERWMEHVTNDAVLAIRYVFGVYAVQALVVADCESGLSRNAHNGQYLGLFQMGDYARDRFGHGETFLAQARAAHRYFVSSGRDWSPWACRPY